MDKGSAVACQSTPPGGGPPPWAGWLRRLPLVLLAVMVAAVVLSGAWRHLSLAELRDRHAALKGYVGAHPARSLAAYMGLYAAVVALSLPGALIMSLSGGYLFGVVEGAPAAVVGMSIGASAMFFAARSALGAGLASSSGSQRKGRLDKIKARIRENAFSTVLTLRLIPGVPFGLVNILAGVVGVRAVPYLAATLMGVTPSTVIYCWLGRDLGRVLDGPGPPQLSKLITPEVYIPLVGLMLLALTPTAVKLLRGRGEKGGGRA